VSDCRISVISFKLHRPSYSQVGTVRGYFAEQMNSSRTDRLNFVPRLSGVIAEIRKVLTPHVTGRRRGKQKESVLSEPMMPPITLLSHASSLYCTNIISMNAVLTPVRARLELIPGPQWS
jgi:hypothetical protein